MIPKKLRLPKDQFFKKNNGVTTPICVIKFKANSLGHNRFAVVVSSKVEAKSTLRHLIKRRFFAVLKNWPNLGLDLIIIALPEVKNFSFADIKIKILESIPKIKIKNGPSF